jgi:D-sedoheptulose 7-phosphate isomerase
MNNIENIYRTSLSPSEFARGYLSYLKELLDQIEIEALDLLAKEFEDAREHGNNIFVAGNGGSATTAATMANDMSIDVLKKANCDRPFKIFALTDNNAIITAISNDSGYENLFVNQLKIHYRQGDRLLVISASGNSPNVVKAAEWVTSHGGRVIGFLGFSGGRLREICDITIHVKTNAGEYGPVEDIHLILNHILAHWFQNKLKQKT